MNDYFDASFFQHEGAPVLVQFVLIDGRPDASDLATRWADSLNLRDLERRTFYVRQLEPIALDFLEDLTQTLKAQEALSDLNGSRVLNQILENSQAFRRQLGATKATSGTRLDYLHWLLWRNTYLDVRGTYQTQRQVQVKLDDVYISLLVRSSEVPGTVEHQALEKEFAEQKGKPLHRQTAAKELEDWHDQLLLELELAEMVTHNDRVVILGDPGSGKTTLLRYLALQHADALLQGRTEAGADLGKARFPILLCIAEYAENDTWKKQPLTDFLANCFTAHDCPKDGLADLLYSELVRGNCLVLLDGLDEIVSPEERLGVVRQIEDFVRRHGHRANRFVITSRIAGYRIAPLGEPFTHYTL